MLEELYQGLYDDGYFYGSFKQFQEKFKDLDYRKTLHAGIVNDGDFTGDFNTFENKFTGAATEVPTYNPETILSSADYASPIDVAGYNIDAHTSLFNKSEGEAIKELRELYRGFNFEEVALGSKEGGGLDAIKISTKDGKHSATFDMNIGGLNLYGSQAGLSEKEGRDRSFNILKDFVNKYSTDETIAAQDTAKKARRKIWEDINTQRDELAAEEIAKIQEDFDSGELFKLKTDAKVGLMGNLEILIGGREAIPNVVLNTITPYKEEQKRALDDLKAEYKADGNKSTPTTEEVQERALEYIIDGIQEKALTEIIESDEVQGDINLPGSIGLQNKVMNYVNDLFGDNKASLAEKYTIAAKEFDVDFNNDYNTLVAKSLELDNGVEITRFNEINSQLEDPDFEFDIMPGESVVTLQNGRQIPERIFNEFKGLNIKINNKIKALRSFKEKVMEKAVQYGDNAAAIDIARRNYDGLEKFLTTTGLGFTEMYFNATIGVNLMGGGENKEAIDFLSDFKTSTSEIRDSYAKDVQFDDAFDSLANFGTFVAQEVANQIPVFATLAIPGVGAATLGFSAFGEHYTDLSIEKKSVGGRQLSNAEMWWMSAGFGASELVFESLTTIPLLRAAKRGFSATPGKKTLLDQTMGKYFKKNIGKTVYGIASEPIGEGMTQLTQNIIDGKPLTQGLAHAMFSGLMFGTTLSTAPFAKGLYLSQFNDHSANIDYRERVDKIKNLNKTNLNIKINLKAGITGVGTQADIDVNNKAIADLQAENETHVREQEALVNGLSDDATKYYFALNSELEGIKNEAIEVDNNTTLTDRQKNDRLKQLQVKFDSKQRQKDFFRDKNAFGNEWDAYSGLDENADDVAALKKQAGDDLVNINLEATKARRKEPTEIEINQRAKFLYNIRKIKKDHAANSKAGLTDTKLFETNQDAITWVEKQTNISEATKAKFLNDIKDSNAHGANIKTQDGQVPFIIANNMAMDDRLETRTHEVGHSVFIKAIGANPAAFKDLSGQITEYLKQANPAAHKRLMFRLNQAGAIKEKLYDETIMVFLEEVASGKVDVAKSKQAGFLANLMNKGIEKVGGKKIDLRGETDAINFLIGIAKKIKAGTIDISDIQAIKENRIAKQAKKSAPKTKVEPTTKLSKTQTKTINDLGKQIVDEDGNVTDLEKEGQGNAYFQVEAENIWKQIQKQGLLDGLILAQPHEGVKNKTFLDTTYAELFSWFKKYQPERKNPSGLLGHINPQIPNRAKQAYNDITKGEIKYTQEIGETTKEGEVKVQVAAETDVAMEAFETEDLSIQGQAKKNKAKKQRYSQLRQEMGFKREVLDKDGNVVEEGDKIHKEVLESAKKSLIMAYGATQNITDVQLRAKAVAEKIKKEYNSLSSPLFKQIKNFLTYGIAENRDIKGEKIIYLNQLEKFRVAIVENVSTADFVQMQRNDTQEDKIFLNFVKQVTKTDEVIDLIKQERLPPSALNTITKNKKTGQGSNSVPLYDKIMPSPMELKSWADQPLVNPDTGKRSGLKGTRKDGIVKRVVNSLVTDAIMEARQSEEVQSKIAEMGIDPGSVAELGAAIGKEVGVKFSKSNAVGDVTAAIDGAGDVSVYSQIKFSKAHRDAYEKQLTKRRPDLTEDQRKNAVQSVFDFVDGKEIPNNKKSKYEKMAMHYTANGFLILPEDGYKVVEAERIAAQKKLDPFSFKNPNVLIETYAGQVKAVRTNPDKVKTFSNKTEYTDGVVIYNVEDSKQGQLDTRKVIDTHFGEKANPWCLAARVKDGSGDKLKNAFKLWNNYNKKGNGHQIAFQNGKLIAFRDGNRMQWWDRMDEPSAGPIVKSKKQKDGFRPIVQANSKKSGLQSEILRYEKVDGNSKTGTVTTRNLEGVITSKVTHKNGKLHGEQLDFKDSPNISITETSVYENGDRLSDKETRVYKKKETKDKQLIGLDAIHVDNITSWEKNTVYKDYLKGLGFQTIIVEGIVNQKYFNNRNNKGAMQEILAPFERYNRLQGEKVRIETTLDRDNIRRVEDFQSGEFQTLKINGVQQQVNQRQVTTHNGIKFSLTKLEINNKLDPHIIKMIEGSKNGVNPIAEYFYSSMQLQLSNGVKVDVAYDIAYNNTEKVHGIGFIARNDFESNVKNYYAPDIRKDAKKYAADYYKDQLKTVQTDKNTVNVDELNAINDYLINIGRPIRSAMVDYITSNEKLLEEVYKKFGEKYRGHYHLVKAKPRGYKVEFSEKKNGKQQSINLYQEVTAIKKNPAKYEQIISEQSDLARKWLDNLLDSGMDKGKIKAILQLTSYGQRSPIRKLSKLGVYAKTGIAKDLVLEHEITANDILAEITKHIDGKIKERAQLNSFLNNAYVHVLPKGIDKLIKKYPGHVSNRNGKGYESMPLVENKIKELIDKKKLKGNTQLFKLSKSNDFQTIHKAVKLSRSTKKPTKGITVLDFDDTLATSKSLVKFTKPDGTKGTLNAEQYASTYESLSDLGYKFDFSEFTKVVDGKTAPLFNKAMKLQGKFGSQNMFVLTARPAESAGAIHTFLKANGLNIPLKNITGLANSTSEAKALWMADKVAEGYNDFYFADDALQNVQAVDNMLSQFDVKRKVQQARVKFSKSEYNTNKDPYSFVNFKTVPKEIVNSKSYKKWIKSLEGMKLFHGTTTDPNKISELGTNHSLNWFIVGGNNNQKAIALTKEIEREYDGEAENSVLSIDASELAGRILPDADFIGPSDDMSISKDKTFQNKIKALEDKYKTTARVQPMIRKPKMYAEFLDIITEHNPMSGYSQVLFDKNGKLNVNSAVVIIGGLKPNQLKVESISDPTTAIAPKFSKSSLRGNKAVKNMLDQFDVKSKVQQAKVKFSKNMDTEFNNILENITGIESKKRFSIIKGRKRGESKGKFRFFIPPSHEDFIGLLYNFMGKGKEGNAHRDFFEKALVRPLNRGYREIDTAKQAIANDYKSLNKQFPDVKDKLVKATPDGDFTFQDAIRVYLWNKHGYKIPGLTETDQKKLTELVMSDPQLQAYAETLNVMSKQENYVAPGQAWETANIRIDLVDATGRVGRADYFTEFNENAEVIFSQENLNKIEAGYGRDFREALEDMLHRIKTGVNRPKGASGKPNMFMNWLNASVSGVMFFNTRSALLQQMSNVNFLNFADNNIFAAGKAFANQPQYWKDFAMIFNSDMMKQRRGGLGTDINGAELAEAIKKARPGNMFDQVSIIVGKALKLGFLPTQIGDNIAIATGGASFYRNRVNKYVKDGLSVKEAETKAFTDLQNITQSTQQSARPDMTSKQQASWIGKLVLNFLNTPSQYNRIIKKAGSDIKNRRITPPNTTQAQSDMSNASRILYYGAAQNLIFYSLQTALFAVMFDDDEESEALLKKKERVINGTIDTILRGSGIYGVAISTLKNMTIKFLEQREKGYNKDESAVIMEMLNFSPVVGIKARKVVNAEKTLNYNKDVIDEMETFDIDNPQWSAVTNYVESITTAPVNRLYQKTINLRNAADNNYTALQRLLFFSGYTTWSLDLGDTEKMKNIKSDIKEKKKKEKKSSKKKKPLTREQIRIKNRNKSRRKIK